MQAGGRRQGDEAARRVQADAPEVPVPVDGGERGDGIGVGLQHVDGGAEGTGQGGRVRVHDSDLPPFRPPPGVARYSRGVYVTDCEGSIRDRVEVPSPRGLASAADDEHRVARGHGASGSHRPGHPLRSGGEPERPSSPAPAR